MEKYLKGPVRSTADYSDKTGEAFVHTCRIWDGVFVSANTINKKQIVHKGKMPAEACFLNCCLDGRCEVNLGDRYVYVEKGMISLNRQLPNDGYYYPGSLYKGVEIVLFPEIMEKCALDELELKSGLVNFGVSGSGDYIGTLSERMMSVCEEAYEGICAKTLSVEELRYFCIEIIYRLMHGEVKEFSGKAYVSKGQRSIARLVEQKLCEDLGRRVTARMLSDDLGMAESTIKKYFEAVYGANISDYVRNKRMEQAKRLLTDSEENIGSIAILCGYNNQSKFGSVFKKETGCTPFEYRCQSKIGR